MNILLATSETQGQKRGDFCWTDENEIVTLPFMCDNSCTCGCARALGGVKSKKSTTTFKVVDSPMHPRDFHIAILEDLITGGWYKKGDRKAIEHSRETAAELRRIAGLFKPGTILEKTRTKFRVRKAVA